LVLFFKKEPLPFRAVIIGAGPAGLAPLLAAHRQGRLDPLLDRGIALVERSATPGSGAIGDYAINSDSTGSTFVDCLRAPIETDLTALQSHPLSQAVAAAGDGPVPLALVGRFMALVGGTLAGMIARHPGCAVLTGHRAIELRRTAEGWSTKLEDASGRIIHLSSRLVISATGAEQPRARLAAERVAGIGLADRYGAKLMQSGDVFMAGGLQSITKRLGKVADPRVAVIGGSTSAAAVAHALLHRLPGISFGDGAVTLLHRRALNIYYPSVQAALAEGYTEFGDDDICPVSKRVFRFAGFRLDSRELIMQARGIGGRAPERRLALHRLQPQDQAAIDILDRADIIIAAFGYRPRAIRVLDIAGEPIALQAGRDPRAPLVDGQCRIMDAEGAPIPGLFGIGLAAGFVPSGPLGGEPSFSGQANGLWLWQNDVGLLIADAMLNDGQCPAAPSLAWPQPSAPASIGAVALT
jgi:hypothetical protein